MLHADWSKHPKKRWASRARLLHGRYAVDAPSLVTPAQILAHLRQSRPVTVVRIVTEATIEEKVLSLHAKKRQLFDDVVTGSDGGGALEMETLATLLV